MLGILQRYTLREIFMPSLLGLLVSTFLLMVHEIFQIIDLLVNTSVTLGEAGEIIVCLMPRLLTLTIPMALLLGVLLGLGRMAAENEVLAIRTSGINLWRIYWPIVVVCALISLAMIYANYNWTPRLQLRAEDAALRVRFKLGNAFHPGRTYTDFSKDNNETAFYFGARDPENNDLLDVALKMGDSEEGDLRNSDVFISAPRGRILASKEQVSVKLVLEDGRLDFRTREPGRENEYDIMRFDRLTYTAPLDIGKRSDDGTFKKNEEMLTMAELNQRLEEARRHKETDGEEGRWWKERRINEYMVERAERYSMPMACLAVVLLAMPLAIFIRPSAKTLAFGIALGLIFFYYVLSSWGVQLGLSGKPIGIPLIFLPNLLLGGIGVILMWRSIRQ